MWTHLAPLDAALHHAVWAVVLDVSLHVELHQRRPAAQVTRHLAPGAVGRLRWAFKIH